MVGDFETPVHLTHILETNPRILLNRKYYQEVLPSREFSFWPLQV